jgi:hypothetical protein
VIDTHDVVVQHLRIRVGNIGYEPHALWIRDNARDVVIDHVSLSWSVWNSVSIFASDPAYTAHNITIADSIIAESLACSGVNRAFPCDASTYPNSGYSNSRGILIGKSVNVSLLRNITANINDRHPEIQGSTSTILVNNLIYNPSLTPWAAIGFSNPYEDWTPSLSVVKGNVLIPGPTTPGHQGYVAPEYADAGPVSMFRLGSLADGSRIFLEDNYYAKDCGGGSCLASTSAQWRLAQDWSDASVRASSPPLSADTLPLDSVLSHGDVESYALANAGARPADRDAVDERIIEEIRTRTGSVPNHTSEKAGPGTDANGFPILAENRRPLSVPQDPHAVVDSVGRTRIEAWLEQFARELEPGWGGSSAPSMPEAPEAPGSVSWAF